MIDHGAVTMLCRDSFLWERHNNVTDYLQIDNKPMI